MIGHMIETREALDAVRAGTFLIDRDGYIIYRNDDGDFELFEPDADEAMCLSADEIMGEYNDGESMFLPLEVFGTRIEAE